MRNFWILFKYEWKKSSPFHFKRMKTDIVGNILSALVSLFIVGVVVVLLSTVANNYVAVKIDKVKAPMQRAVELLNACYTIIILFMSGACMEKMRKTLTQKKDKELFLRFPIKPQTIFLSKFALLVGWNHLLGFFLVMPVNLIVYFALKPAFTYWFTSLLVWALLPFIPFLIATVLIVPYIKIIDFISNKYSVLFVVMSAILIGAFLLYSEVLAVVQSLLETGSIKFLFNAKFIGFLQKLLKITYPANAFAHVAIGTDFVRSLLIVVGFFVVAAVAVYIVPKTLFYVTLYKNENRRKTGRKTERYTRLSPVVSLIKKEFISVFREPKHLFSYFAIATAMPIMVYSCYTLFESLIRNALGISANFSLALLILLVFSILTNTFCSTNVTRDGLSALNAKTFPLKPSRILFAKVVFCAVVSSLAVALSCVLLTAATSLKFWDGLICCGIGVLFSVSQIFLATRMDLKHAKVSASPTEVEAQSSKTVAKVVCIGFLLALVMGICSLVVSIVVKSKGLDTWYMNGFYTYMIPVLVGAAYFALSILYYRRKLDESFEKFVA
ncbi:MAG: hypothetical protein IJV85_03755 [Clostridia bacterium]|nr:hypothetical protein [Clostridia bacterium]